MCGRYVISLTLDQLSTLFEIDDRINLAPNWNAAPTQSLPIVRRGREGEMRLSEVRWGLVPHWSKTGPDGAKPLINARAETAAEKPTFRNALKRRRALVPADGFYEWAKTEAGKQPYFITRTDGAPMVFAGLWERWGEGDERLDTFASHLFRPFLEKRGWQVVRPDPVELNGIRLERFLMARELSGAAEPRK